MTYKRRPTLLSLTTSHKDCPIDISKREYLDITEGFMKFISDKIIEGERVNLPSSMGIIEVRGRKQEITIDGDMIKGLAPNWKETLKLWEKDEEAKKKKTRIFHFNEHSRGIRYKFIWINIRVPIRTKQIFRFIATRKNKRRLWKEILNKREFTITNNNKL
jgi:hypothetical protein